MEVLKWTFTYVLVLFVIIGNIKPERKKFKGKVVIAGLFPMSTKVPEWTIGRGVRPAVDLALEMINKDRRLLPEYKLDIVDIDTECEMAVATKFFFDMVDSNNTMVMVFGDACSRVSGPIAEVAKEWNVSLTTPALQSFCSTIDAEERIPDYLLGAKDPGTHVPILTDRAKSLLSYADTDPILSDRKKYINFYRTVPSESDFNPARLALLRKFNWSHVGTIFQGVSKETARYGYAHNDLILLLEKANINVIKSVGFVNDPEPAILELKKCDARIIIGNFDVNMARHVFCQAYKNRMYGPKYQWIIFGGYPDSWWNLTEEHKVPCTAAELNKTINGYIATDILPLSSSRRKTESGLSPLKYQKLYLEKSEGNYSKYHAYAFDGVWVIAKAVDSILRKFLDLGSTSTALGLYGDIFRGDHIAVALNETNFRGVTGEVRFDGGDRIGSILFEQFQGDRMEKIGEYHKINDRLKLCKNCRKIIWPGKGPPLDRKLVRIEFRHIPNGIYYSICTLAGCGIIMSVFFLVINIVFQQHRYIKMSSPNLNNIIIIGCILTYLSVFLLGTDGSIVHRGYLGYICTSRAWVLSLGFTLAFGAMFSKTWRVHSIFTDIKLHKKVIKDYKLILVVSILLVIDVGILITWLVMDPLQTATKTMTIKVEGDLEITPVVEYCKSQRMTIWLGLIYAYKGLLLVFGCFLAWETRQVSIPALNDSKYIGMSVYNVVIMCVCGAAVSFVISDQPTSSFVIISFFIIFCTTITLCLVFVPKIIELKRDPTGEERRIRAKLQKPRKQTSREQMNDDLHKRNEDLQAENIRYRNVIVEKLRTLHHLLEQLGEGNVDDALQFPVKSPIHKKVIELRLADSSPSKFSTVSSDVDDGSLFSETSYGTTTWTIASQPNIRLETKRSRSLPSAQTSVTSVVDSIDSISTRRASSKWTPTAMSTKECIESDEGDDEDDPDAFGGVYCGPPNRSSFKFRNSRKEENGRATTLTEVQPLVHDFPNRTYMTGSMDGYKQHRDNDIINNITFKAGSSSDVKAKSNQTMPSLRELKKNTLSELRKKRRKITFMFPNQDRLFNEYLAGTMTAGRCTRDGSDTDSAAEMSCDIIEHI